ncbi:MAG: UDP-3-O-(3-hydroxymyristoyl)glucosamine N-acyltransferase [Thermoguttaceae bacterium]
MSEYTLAEIATYIGGTLHGDGNMKIRSVAPIQSATQTDITFLDRADRITRLKRCSAGAIIVPDGIKPDDFAVIQVHNVLEAFEKIAKYIHSPDEEKLPGIALSASVDPRVKLGNNVRVGHAACIGANVEIGDNTLIHAGVVIHADSKIGANSIIFPNVVLYRDTQIGNNCIIHANSVIGAFGFGYDSKDGIHKLSPQMGNVVIHDNVEIGSCTTIDRATYGSTIIGEGTKIDNLVMIGHNCKLGNHNLICAHTGIAGSTTTGDYVVMAGRVGVRDHVHIGDRAILGAMAGIITDVDDGARLVGIPATPEKEQMRMQVAFAKLPELRKEFKKLCEEVKQLKAQVAAKSQID